jgi:hypothetical protein
LINLSIYDLRESQNIFRNFKVLVLERRRLETVAETAVELNPPCITANARHIEMLYVHIIPMVLATASIVK